MSSDNVNHQIISALQINPRISWSRLGEVLDADPTTISRRWRRMIADGIVWTTCFEAPPPSRPNPIRVAWVEIVCAPGQRDALITLLSEQELCYNIRCVSGDRDILATISGPSIMTLDDLVQEHIARLPGITRTRTRYLQEIYFEGADWRLPSLLATQEADVAKTLPPKDPGARPKAIHREIIAALSPDLRLPLSDLSHQLGYSKPTVSRAIETLLSSDWARFRIDLAHDHMGWEAEAIIWMEIDGSLSANLAASINRMPETRFCTAISGRENLAASLWLRRLTDLAEFEHRLQQIAPSVRIVDRWVVPRVAKRLGHVLNSRGLHEKYVPIGVLDRVPAGAAAPGPQRPAGQRP